MVNLVTPNGQAVGDVITIYGEMFTGRTGITIDGATVTNFLTVADNQIATVIPATVAGTAAVVVTNAAGASNSYDYTAA